MKIFKGALIRLIVLVLLAGTIVLNAAGCSSGANEKEKREADDANGLLLAGCVLKGIAEGKILITEEPKVYTVKPGETSFTIDSCDILKEGEIDKIPDIELMNSKNKAWRITFTYKPEITVEVIDDADNPKKVILVFPQEVQ